MTKEDCLDRGLVILFYFSFIKENWYSVFIFLLLKQPWNKSHEAEV